MPRKHFVNNNKITDHHVIIPTEQKLLHNSLSESEEKIFDLVVKRFLSVLYPFHEYKEITIKGECSGDFYILRYLV
ncbi:MAG: DNA topoisomerase [Eubacteriales bacterium]